MISAEQSQQMARQRARESAQEGLRPCSIWPEDMADESGRTLARAIPYLGDRERIRAADGPPMWVRSDVRGYLPTYRYAWFFVDSSGFGGAEEPAATVPQFRNLVLEYCGAAHADGYTVGLGIAEAGQFQVHIAPYLRKVN